MKLIRKYMKSAVEVREIAASVASAEEIADVQSIPERIENRASNGYTSLYVSDLNGWRSGKTDPVTLAKLEMAEALLEKGYWFESGDGLILHWDEKPEDSSSWYSRLLLTVVVAGFTYLVLNIIAKLL